MQDFHTTVLFDISRTADKEIRYRRRERREAEGGGVFLNYITQEGNLTAHGMKIKTIIKSITK